MTATEYVVDVLGGTSVFKGRTVPTSTELRERIRRGLPYRSLESVRERLGLSDPEAAASVRGVRHGGQSRDVAAPAEPSAER